MQPDTALGVRQPREVHYAETALLTQFAALSVWLMAPALWWGAIAGAASVVAALVVPRAKRRGLAALAALGVAAAIVAVSTSWRVRAVEQRWPEVREELIRRASLKLGTTLETSVGIARRLADRGAEQASASPADAFSVLASEVRAENVEAGVVVLEADGQPWSWAGRHRIAVDRTAPAELYARMTSFYVVLEARRQPPSGGRVSVGQVLLAADSAVPDRDRSVASRFAEETGAQIEFFPPGRGPAGSDVFDYCIPSCTPSAQVARPDTLFSVRTSPPAQGAFKLTLLAMGSRAVAWLLAAGLGSLLLLGGRQARYASVGLAATLLVLTSVGGSAGLGGVFSPVTYYLAVLDPLTGSVGGLMVTGAVLVTAVVSAWPRRAHAAVAWLAVAVGLMAPVGARFLAGGITPPATGARLTLWLAWEVAVALSATGLALLAVWGISSALFRVPRKSWYATVAVVIAIGAGLLGVVLWQPGGGWPWLYPALWVPGVFLAAAGSSPLRQMVSATVVASSAAALFTWGAVVDGRLSLARADVGGLGDAHDPTTLAVLERFGADIASRPAPRSPAELYRRWSRTPLERDGYPAVLATWYPDGDRTLLPLAELELPLALLQAEARTAILRGGPVVEEFARVPGIHTILAAPASDGAVVTVGVGPRSRLLPPFRIAQFLRRQRTGPPPYELSVSEPAPGDAGETFTWRRSDRFVRGEARLEFPGGARHLHVTVDLGSPEALLVRGALFLVLDAAIVLLLWAVAETLAGRSGLRSRVKGMLRFSSYRLRLTVALAVFFIVPTVGFAAWMGGRLRSDTAREHDLVARQALRDATGALVEAGDVPLENVLPSIASRAETDLVWYGNGLLTEASSPFLPDLGLIDPYLPPEVYRALLLNDALEVTANVTIAGRPTRVSYRAAGVGARSGVLAAPRLVDEPPSPGTADLAFALLLVTLLGLGAAAGLARIAAQSLARPVGALRAAAAAVGRGEPLPPFAEAVPEEFASVSDAFTRMAADVRTSQAALEAARQRTAAVLRHVATGVIGLTGDLRVSVVNPRAEQLVGATLTPDGSVRDGTAAEWAPVWTWAERFLGTGKEIDAREFTVGGRRILVQVSTLGVEAGGCVMALDDMTDLAHAVRVLAWGEMARQVAHEIKNPLTPLRLGIQHLQRAFGGESRGEFEGVLDRTSKQILGEIDRLDAVARSFARFGTPSTEQQAGPLGPVDLTEVARETAALYTLGGDTRVSVVGDGPVRALARRDELKEVLVNLLENARNAGATTVELVAGRGSLSVRDNGRGIPAALIPRVFEPHFSTTTSGTGLGLAICKRLVESWGGSVEVNSEEGRGTTVTVRMAVG